MPANRVMQWTVGGCAALLLMLTAVNGMAAPRRSYGSSYARQLRNRTIAAVRQEIAAAKQVLEQVQSRQGQSQSDLQAAAAKLASSRKETDAAEQADNELHQRLREIEERVLNGQGVDSEYAKQLSTVEAARARLDGEMHRVLGLPAHPESAEMEKQRMQELSALTEAELEQLNSNAAYCAARDALLAEHHKLTAIEKSLLSADKEWQSTVGQHHRAEQQEQKAKSAQRSSAGDTAQARAEIANQQQLAARARASITAGEARLRQLGVQP